MIATLTEPKSKKYEDEDLKRDINAFYGALLVLVLKMQHPVLDRILSYLSGSDEPADNLLGTTSFTSSRKRWAGVKEIAQKQLKEKPRITLRQVVKLFLFKKNEKLTEEREVERFCRRIAESSLEDVPLLKEHLEKLPDMIKIGLCSTGTWSLSKGSVTVEQPEDREPLMPRIRFGSCH